MNQRRRLHEKRVQRMGGESGWAGIDKNSGDTQEACEENPCAAKKRKKRNGG